MNLYRVMVPPPTRLVQHNFNHVTVNVFINLRLRQLPVLLAFPPEVLFLGQGKYGDMIHLHQNGYLSRINSCYFQRGLTAEGLPERQF